MIYTEGGRGVGGGTWDMKEQKVFRWGDPQEEKSSMSEKVIFHYRGSTQSLLGSE